MTDIIEGNLYDFPKYYDLVFGSDWKAEFDFLTECFGKHCGRSVKSVFEPACGTGRLLIKLAQAGFSVSGNDLNPHAIDYCNARLGRHGFPASTFVGDMADFQLDKPVDAAFNMINSFRHLPTETAAENHLNCMARCLKPGGLYALGLHLMPTRGPKIDEEAWSARRGNLAVNSYMWTREVDTRNRMEHLGMTFDIYTPTSHSRIRDNMQYRTYTRKQFFRLLSTQPALELVETYDFAYEIDDPIEIDAMTEDVVFVLKKR